MCCSRGRAQQPDTKEDDEAAADGELQPLRVEPDVPSQLAGTLRVNSPASPRRLWMSQHTWSIVKAAGAVGPVWFMAQLCFNVSLHMTSVTSNTILSSPSSLFTYFLSILVLQEKFTYNKLGGVVLTVAGAPRCNEWRCPPCHLVAMPGQTASGSMILVRSSPL